MNQEYKIKRQIKKEEKRKRRIRRGREQIARKVMFFFAYLVVLFVIFTFFHWQWYENREMTPKNTEEIVVYVDDVDVYVNRGRGGSHKLSIISGDLVYMGYPPSSAIKAPYEELTHNDRVVLTVTNNEKKELVGVRTDSKVYYDVELHYNKYARQERICIVIGAILVYAVLFVVGCFFLSNIIDTYKENRKLHRGKR